MTNIQDILNQIRNSDIAKVGQSSGGLDNYATRKKVHVFYNGKHIETINGFGAAERKYGHSVLLCMKRKRPIKGFYFSYNEVYDIKPERDKRDNTKQKKVIVKYRDGICQSFISVREAARTLSIGNGTMSNVLCGKRPIPKKLENVDKIFFSE